MIIERISCRIDKTSVNGWLFDVPAVSQLAKEGLTFSQPITFLVGENGSGKSTIVVAIAEAYGLDARGGRAGRRFVNDRPKTPLGECLQRLDRKSRLYFVIEKVISCGLRQHMVSCLL